jgi:ABC-2 type transport system permease protein
MLLWALGLVTFWTTRVGAIFDVFFTVELLVSGRLVPLSLMPPWVRDVAAWLPFQWAFQFPIETLIGRLSHEAILRGLAMQALWTLIGVGILAVVWPMAVKRYSAVGG